MLQPILLQRALMDVRLLLALSSSTVMVFRPLNPVEHLFQISLLNQILRSLSLGSSCREGINDAVKIGYVFHSVEERSTRNTSNRSQQDILHKSGRTSFAQRAETMRGELQRSPTRAEVFQKCYKGKNGYVNAATEEATERLVAMASQCPENEDAIFREVLGPERKGRKRGMGWTTNPDADITLLRFKIEKMTTELAERDARDKERDIKDAQIQQKIVELENKFESLSRCLVMQVPPQAPHQFLTSQFSFEQQIQRPYYQSLMPSFMELVQSGSVGNNGLRMFGGSNRNNEE